MVKNNKNIIENRLSIVLGVLAILIAIIYLPVQFFLKVINMYPQEGAKYIYLHFLSSAFITCILFVVWFLLKFIYYEILSCNVLQKQYLIKKYKHKANYTYNCFIEHFRFSMVAMIYIFFMAYIFIISEQLSLRINIYCFILICFCCMVVIIFIVIKFKKEMAKKLFAKIFIYVGFGITIYYFGLVTLLGQSTTSLELHFNETGLIETRQTTNTSSVDLQLSIHEWEIKIIFLERVYLKKLLLKMIFYGEI